MNPQFALEASVLLLVVLAAAQDVRTRTIPNRLLAAGLLLALLLHLLSASPGPAVANAAAGAATGLALFLPLYLLRGMAAGDVKLLATVGAFVGPGGVCAIALATCCFGGFMALAVTAARGQLSRLIANLHQMWLRLAGLGAPPLAPAASVGGLPYGLAIAAGTLFEIGLRHLF
ncbi:prepilin peptidase [Massilia sp. TS11]|uniref:prepilin peptidase n=1 Tax=Massilia sp. TS11 TaxID=2908003 RepID=UPI001EDA1CA9|nr:prepilin peptidase [Massilia sp. TS11]MCG2585805.1 prepilin peptidase [Massilia sp. TS11]